jgi:hypothetical protein
MSAGMRGSPNRTKPSRGRILASRSPNLVRGAGLDGTKIRRTTDSSAGKLVDVGPWGPTASETNEEAKSRMDRPQHKNPAQHGPGGKYEGGESTGGYADHQTKNNEGANDN